jgi:hypothetical protein
VTDFSEAIWIEAWMDTKIHYVLLLVCLLDGTLKIYDPQEQKLVDETFTSYQEARWWLVDDEYIRIEIRYQFDKT